MPRKYAKTSDVKWKPTAQDWDLFFCNGMSYQNWKDYWQVSHNATIERLGRMYLIKGGHLSICYTNNGKKKNRKPVSV